MTQKLFNLTLALIFFALVLLFAYKMTNSPEVVSAAMPDSENTAKHTGNIDSNELKSQMQAIVKDYIMNNPEVIVSSLEGLHSKNLAESNKKAANYLQDNKAHIEEVDSPPIMGNPNGDIVIVVFYDYNCSFCKKAHTHENEIVNMDPGVKIILRPIPILGTNSLYAAKVALAVQKVSSNNFLNVHNELMGMKEINVDNVKAMLGKYNIDYNIVENEVNSYALQSIVDKNIKIAKEVGINGTPSYVINNNFIAGLIPTDKFKAIIMQLRASIKKPEANLEATPQVKESATPNHDSESENQEHVEPSE